MSDRKHIEFTVQFNINNDGDYTFELNRRKQNNSLNLHAHGNIPLLENSEALEERFESMLMGMSTKSTNWTLSKTTPNK